MWSVWDKKSDINGFSAEWFLDRNKKLQDEETIFLRMVNGRVTQVEGKSILARNYGIDLGWDNEAFIAEYERIIEELAKKAAEGVIEE